MTGSDEVAEDIVQDVFMNIWTKREGLVNIENPSSYFADVTDQMILAHESINLIYKAVEKLPPQQQLVYKLCKQEGLSREDVAHQLHISPNTVKNHLADAIKFIRVFLRNSTLTFLIILWFFKK